jgi:Fe-S cluster assembly protein SufD
MGNAVAAPGSTSVMALKLGPALSASTLVRDGEPSWLRDRRAAAWERFESLPWPSRNDEAWRKTDITNLDFQDCPLFLTFGKAADAQKAMEAVGGFKASVAGHVRYLGSHLVRGESGALRPLVDAAGDGAEVKDAFGDASSLREQKFSSLNEALWDAGAALTASKGSEVKESYRVSYVFPPGRSTLLPRTLIVVEEGASARLYEEWFGSGADKGLMVSHTEVVVRRGGSLTLVQHQSLPRTVTQFGSLKVRLEEGAQLELATVETGGGLTKRTIEVSLDGPDARFAHKGIIAGRGRQHFDVQEFVDHVAPRTQSNLFTKSAMRDKARSIFIGLLKVHPGAVKIKAYEINRNLMLSRGARADSQPKLEILADDVQCGHGSSTGTVDDSQLYYLMSRGLDRAQSERVIVEGFMQDILAKMPFADSEKMGWLLERLRVDVMAALESDGAARAG